jgi:hypothetical protein
MPRAPGNHWSNRVDRAVYDEPDTVGRNSKGWMNLGCGCAAIREALSFEANIDFP